MSVRILYLSFSPVINPIAMPAAGDLIGTPASIRLSDDAETVAIDEDPFEERISETTLTVYGNSSLFGISGLRAFSASAPCPMSRLPGPRNERASPTENGGKL